MPIRLLRALALVLAFVCFSASGRAQEENQEQPADEEGHTDHVGKAKKRRVELVKI